MSFFINNALADAATTTAANTQASSLPSLLMLLAFVVVFYLLLWRPQAKRAKEHRNLLSSLAKGDEVVTSGGLVGKVNKITDDFVILTIADNIDITVQKAAVSGVLPKGSLKAV